MEATQKRREVRDPGVMPRSARAAIGPSRAIDPSHTSSSCTCADASGKQATSLYRATVG